MNSFYKKFVYFIVIFWAFKNFVCAETLSYNGALSQAINNSYDLKLSNLDIEISKAELNYAKSDLYPILSIQANTEYNNGLGNSRNNIGYVGGTVITSQTQFRNMALLGVQYNLYDFGARGKKILISQKDVEQKQVTYDLQLKDLKLKVLNLYTKVLLCNDEIKMKSELLKVYEEMFKAKERLFKAGMDDKISLMDEAIKLARTQDNIQSSKLELKKNLNDLSIFTQQKYSSEKLDIRNFEEKRDNIVPISNTYNAQAQITEGVDFDKDFSLEAKYYDVELEKKKAELEMYKRQRFPVVRFYTSYLFYGQDPNQYFTALGDLKQSSLTVGLSATCYLFDGFKNKSMRKKATLEIEKIKVEKEKKLAQLQNDYEKSYFSYETYNQELVIKTELLNTVKEKLSDVDRLYEKGFTDKNNLMVTKAELLNQEFELQKNIVDISSKIKEIEIIAGKDI